MPDPMTEHRLQSEAAFFDRVAAQAEADLRPLSEEVVSRYLRHRRRRFPAEYRFREAGDLRGKRVLDVGCGDGANSVLLAKLGASVHGIDISPGAISLARKRAQLNGVAEQTWFRCAPMEAVQIDDGGYDVVWCDAILHHLISELDEVLPRFRSWLRPGGVIVMTEPVNLSPVLRRLRFAVAAPSEHTPDERPLERAELELVRRLLPGVRIRYFRALARIDRWLLPGLQFESAGRWQRSAYSALSALDTALLAFPGLRRLASVVVMTARY